MRGVNFIDTADVYSEGESEPLVGEALKAARAAARSARRRDQGARAHGARARTRSASRATTSSQSSTRACAGSGSITSTSTRSTASTRRRRSRRRCARSTTSFAPARCATSGFRNLPAWMSMKALAMRTRTASARFVSGADVLLDRGPRHRARDRAAVHGPGPRHHAVEPARRRLAVAASSIPTSKAAGARRADVRLPARRSRPPAARARGDARGRDAHGTSRRARRARVAAHTAVRHERHHRREERRSSSPTTSPRPSSSSRPTSSRSSTTRARCRPSTRAGWSTSRTATSAPSSRVTLIRGARTARTPRREATAARDPRRVSFPSDPDEDIGRGSPATARRARLFAYVRTSASPASSSARRARRRAQPIALRRHDLLAPPR